MVSTSPTRKNTRNIGLGVLSRVLSRDLSRVTLVLLDGHFYLLLQEVRHKCCIWTKCFQALQRCRCTAGYALKLLIDFFSKALSVVLFVQLREICELKLELRSFPSSLVPLFQNECECNLTFLLCWFACCWEILT